MNWTDHKLGELIEIKHGYAFKGQHFSDSGEYILLTPGNCYEKGGLKLKGDKEKYFIGDIPEDFILKQGDLLIVMTDLIQVAPILGGAFVIPEENKFLHNQRLGLVTIKNNKKLDKMFLYYLLNTENYRAQVRGSASGATVRHTAPNRIYNCNVKISNLFEQQKIASTLFAYDSLIENNRRRIQLLEQSARLLYREWFVHLRFPGHEHVRILEGVPEGWKIKDLNDIIAFSNGSAIKLEEDGLFPVFGSNGIIGSSDQFKYENGIIIGRVGAYCGSIMRCNTRFWASDNTILAFPKDDSSSIPFLFYLLEQMNLNNYAGGAAQPLLTQTVLKKIRHIFPSKNLINDFTEIVNMQFKQIDNLLNQNTKLKEARDILHPRLMNGEITV